ncbi:MAG: hypothetical protein IKO53_08995 [Lachnospiraceae bacterium]|nr:hypothetical protein [Lachnospiraceae bacterium]
MDKLFDHKDLQEKAEWLECLAKYVEWEYALSYQRDIDGVLALLRQMMRDTWDDKGENNEKAEKLQTDKIHGENIPL